MRWRRSGGTSLPESNHVAVCSNHYEAGAPRRHIDGQSRLAACRRRRKMFARTAPYNLTLGASCATRSKASTRSPIISALSAFNLSARSTVMVATPFATVGSITHVTRVRPQPASKPRAFSLREGSETYCQPARPRAAHHQSISAAASFDAVYLQPPRSPRSTGRCS